MPHLNTCLKHFVLFSLKHELVPKKEMAPLAELIAMMLPGVAGSGGGGSGSGGGRDCAGRAIGRGGEHLSVFYMNGDLDLNSVLLFERPMWNH